MRRFLVILFAAVLAVGATACDNGDETADETPTPEVTPAAEATPFPTPEIDGVTLTFADKGYSVEAPEGFLIEANHLFNPAGARYATDAFIYPDAIDGVQPSISITCQNLREDDSSERYRESWGQLASQIAAGGEVDERELTVDGEPAYALAYTQELRERTGEEVVGQIEKTDVIFMASECRWLLAYSAPPGSADEFAPAFEYVLDTFRLLR
jgi:hypothetical protein